LDLRIAGDWVVFAVVRSGLLDVDLLVGRENDLGNHVDCLTIGVVNAHFTLPRRARVELRVFSTTQKSTDGTGSHWKYIIGNIVVYRDVYRGPLTLEFGLVWICESMTLRDSLDALDSPQ
jgi:hypothetical protein